MVLGACLLAGGGITTLLVAANRKEAVHYCRRIDVSVKGSGDKLYITKNDILLQLARAANNPILQQRIEHINVARLENALEANKWIRDAELYFDTHDVLHVVVAEREPIARVFTTAGTSFYIDSAGKNLPLLPNITVRVPVVTAFTNSTTLSKKDSAVVIDLMDIARYIATHPFWHAQIAQIDITPAGTFELLPLVGNSIIRIGHAENLDEKLANLKLFYQQVLSRTGFDTYAVIDIQYKNQVIGSHERTTSVIDSAQLQRNIQELMRRTKLQAEADSLAGVSLATAAAADTASLTSTAPAKTVVPGTTTPAPRAKPSIATKAANPLKIQKPNTTKNQESQPPVPKAVMPKRSGQ